MLLLRESHHALKARLATSIIRYKVRWHPQQNQWECNSMATFSKCVVHDFVRLIDNYILLMKIKPNVY